MSKQVLAVSHRLKECAKNENTSVQEVRGLLSILVEKVLTDTESVASTISRIGEASEFVPTLQLMSWYAGRNPAVFVHGQNGLSDDEHVGEGEVSEEEKQSNAFTSWCVSRILRLLAHKGCESLHEKCRDTISQLLQVIKYRDLVTFHALLAQLVDCAAELVQISDRLAQAPKPRYTETLTSFYVPFDLLQQSVTDPIQGSKPGAVSLSDVPHVIPSLEACELLQTNLVQILDRLVYDVCLCANRKLTLLWGTLCCHVELGDYPLKSASLLVMVKLIEMEGLPTCGVLQYFISCHLALLEKLCGDRQPMEPVGELDQLEECVARLCVQIVREDSSPVSITRLPLTDIRLYYDKVALILGQHGLHNLRRTEIKLAIGRFSCHLMDRLKPALLIGREGIRQKFVDGLLKDFGICSEIQGIVAPVVKSIQSDLLMKSAEPKPSMTAETEEPVEEEDSNMDRKGKKLSKSRAKKRKASDVEERADIEDSSPTFQKLYHKLRETFSRMSERDVSLADLEAVAVYTQVSAHCVLAQPSGTTAGSCFPKTFWNFCTESDMCHILTLWSLFLRHQTPSADPSTLNTGLAKIADSIASLLTLHVYDSTTFRLEHFQSFGWILSLSWLPTEVDWLDLCPQERRKVADMASALNSNIGVQAVARCLRSLSCFPKTVLPRWRALVLGLALNDVRCEVKISALRNLPMFLSTLGTNTSYLVTELLHPFLAEESTEGEVLELLAAQLGDMACVLSKLTSVCVSPTPDINESVNRCVSVVCTVCTHYQASESPAAPKERNHMPFDPKVMLPFLKLLSGDNNVAKTNMVENLGKVFSHMNYKGSTCKAAAMTFLTSCLDLIEDPDYHIRQTFSKAIGKVMNGDLCERSREATDQLIFNRIKDANTRARTEENVQLQKTILLTSGSLGKASEGDRLLVVLINLLESMLSHTPVVAATAYFLLQEIGKSKGIKMQTLFMRFRQPVCKFLADAMHQALETPGSKDVQHILKEVTNVFDFPDVKSCIQVSKKYLLPFLVSRATQTASNVIKILATAMGVKNRKLMLINNTQYIFSCLVRSCHGADLHKALHFLQKETDFELGSLLRFRFQQVHNELLLYLCTNYQQVFRGLQMLGSHDKEPREITTSDEMAAFLQPRLLGFLSYFDVQLADNHVPMEDKKLALESLVAIMRLMGQRYITPVRLKVITTLRRSLELTEEGFPEIACRAWNCFIRSVDHPSLGPLLSQIIAALLSLIEKLPRQVAEIFNFLIVENRVLHGHFHEIYFLPDIPELADANAVLKQYTEGPSSQSDVRSQISHFLKGVTHENLDIRLQALSKLRLLLQHHQSAIHKLIIGNETADPVISQLVSVVLTGCRESDQRARLLYGECLGVLGAIDPGRLDLVTNNPKEDNAHFHASVDDDNFAFDLINDVTRAFLAATEPDVQNCSALALQELLQIYKIGEDKEEGSSGQKLWRRFPEQTQEILLPLLSSKYVLQSNQDWSKLDKPIYMSKKGSKFKDWVTTWTGYLTSKVTEEKARKVFLSCAAQIKHDIHITLYLLPHVVLYVLLDGSEDDKAELFNEIIEVVSQVKKPETRHGSASDFRHMSAQTVYSVFDYLNKWKQRRAQVIAAKAGTTKGEPAYLSDVSYQAVTQFLESIPLDELSEASYNCKGYTRALLYFEHYITSTKQDLQEHLDFLQQLYASMDEADGVQGVAAVRHTQATLHEEILVHECTGQLTYALACYERAIQLESSNISLHQGLLRNYMDLGQQSTALVQVSGILSDRRDWMDQLNSYRVEAAWKLGSWNKLETFTALERQRTGWSVGLARVLLAAKHRDEEEFLSQLTALRGEQMGPLSAASMESGSYQRGYENITRLHMLNELEHGLRSLVGFPSDDPGSGYSATPKAELLRQWEARLSMAQCSFRAQEPILTLRKTLFLLAQDTDDHPAMDKEIGRIWLRIAKVARKAGHLQTSYSAMLQASNCNLTLLCQEKAKLLWTKGDHDQALATLEAGIAENFRDIGVLKTDQSAEAKIRRSEYARALLLFGNYSEETSSMESNAIMRQYKEVLDAHLEWEDGHFYLARYYDKIMTTLIDERDRPEKQGEFTIYVVRYFGQSLRYGNQYIYQSMPRLLSLWLDYGSMVVEAEKKEKGKSSQKLQTQRTILDRLNKIVAGLRHQLAPYQLFTTLPQLISRICHTHAGVSAELQEIIAGLLVAFPQQAMWMMMAVSKSSYPMRVKRCQEIFAKAKDMNRDLHKFILDATKLTERLLELCEKEVPKMMPTLSMTQHFRPLRRLLEDSQFSQVLMPLQDAMTVTLPSGNDSLQNHDPFPGQQVYIDGFEDTIEILPSLQKPKKITMKGSNGRLYVMMCKPKDDLRKDCRLMEFNGIVNKFLRRDPDSRRRQLHIRTYTVVPLNEECGLIEWVNNTSGLRYILIKLYREKCLYMSGKELQACMPALHSSIDTKLTIYRNKLLVRHPPVFSEWFLRTFTDPTSWYSARLSYTRTTAVMSMVGYILGLGDRHGENILFDSTNGDCVHVDFNCLFNKGETFEWPERVPFRLTPNMVEAMGPLGYEGLFRQACEVTLRVMRNQMDSLMSVLKPFVYDPLVEWSKPARGRSNPTESGEITNEQAMTHVLNIEHRLKGILKSKTKPRGLPLSIDGHVNYLIKESTDEKNLCQMYIGWAAYL